MKWTVYNVVLTFVVFSNSPLNGVFSWWGSWSLINLNWPRIVMGNPPLSPPRKYLRLYQTYIFIIEERENKGAYYRNSSGFIWFALILGYTDCLIISCCQYCRVFHCCEFLEMAACGYRRNTRGGKRWQKLFFLWFDH